jgi:hypothetical protein
MSLFALPIQPIAQTQNKRTQTSMPQVGFTPTIPVFQLAKTVHALDRVATVVGPKSKPIPVKLIFSQLIKKVLAFCDSLLYLQEPAHM